MSGGDSMMAVVVRGWDVGAIVLERRPPPQPAPHEIRIRIEAAGLSYVDALTANGGYQARPDLPWIPGSECAGTIDAVGADVTGFATGDRVCALAPGGVWAEAVCLGADDADMLPPTIGCDAGAVIRVAYGTALHALADRVALKAGETLLVLGAGGSVGGAAVEVGKALGARVIAATSRTQPACSALGADHVVGNDPITLRAEVEAIAGRGGIDVVFDPLGAGWTEPAFRTLGPGGRHAVIGFSGGAIPALPTNLALLKEAALIGVNVGRFVVRDPAAAKRNLEILFDWFRNSLIRPAVAHRFSLADFAQAMALALDGRPDGRIVLRPGYGGDAHVVV
jgi:NADPH2:quinone reductase